KKMSQSELGKFIGVSQTTVTAWETGRAEPSSTFISKLADLFNFSACNAISFFSLSVSS
ncbi:helix-turn-helix domain-containing protein, partial [Lactobacillus reuteri]|nr:helix-turn-helix domain-containing protein [Limosilactobacillus reuteri]